MNVRTAMLGVLLGATAGMNAEVIQLKDKAAITGKIIAEKKDQVFVDLGYTMLAIPRNQISKIIKNDPLEARSATNAVVVTAEVKSGLYSTASSLPAERSVRELVSQLGQSVVQVRTPGGLGSGFIIQEEGYLITNFHVIEGETQISVEVYQQGAGQLERRTFKQTRIVAINKFADLALLKIEDADAPRFAKVLLGDADLLAVGERVFAIGSPLGLERTVTEGILSTKTREMQGQLYLQTTAQINPGNSGGPLFNLRGEVIGVTNMKINFGEGLGFAIPVELVKYFLNHRDAFAYDNGNPNNAFRYLDPPRKLKTAPAVEAQ
ncbi:MAG: trypsin-like peptidase domain-containing protein [Verrucomicrobiota bacterium]